MKSVSSLLFLVFCQLALASDDMDAISGTIYEAFRSETMGSLPDKYIYESGVTVVIEHSISYTNESDVAQFYKWCDVEGWLQGKKIQRDVKGFEDLPARGEGKLLWCINGLCEYSLEGTMAHNHIYIGELWYKVTEHGAKIYGLKLIDGD